MRRITALLAVLTTILSTVFSPHDVQSRDDLWKKVDEGLHLGEFASEGTSQIEDSRITIVKVDPRVYSFKLLCASELGRTKLTAKKWCQEHHLISAINAGMYQEDGIRNVGYMKNFNHINNPRLSPVYQAVLAFHPIEPTVPEIQIIDLKCQDFEKLRSKYQTLIQNIRMISCLQENVWSKQDKTWSMAVFGMDKSGKALFIFAKSRYSGHDFANLLLSIPISIHNAMYLEGGQQASLYFSANDVKFEKVGFPVSFNENDTLPAARPIPNVIGFVKKSK
jgi:uncharacterized protein YigE (DUF2233 family)